MNTPLLRVRPTRLYISIQAIVLAALSGQALANDAPADQVAQDNTLPTITLKATKKSSTEVKDSFVAKKTGTATKTSTSIIETPQVINVISRKQLDDQNSSSLNDVLRYTPGIIVGTRGNNGNRYDQMSVRGFGSISGISGTYLDGLKTLGGGYFSHQVDAFEAEQVEVLKGPASVLYGQSSPAGIINLVSKKPKETAQGEIGIQYGTFNHKQFTFDTTGPLTEDGSLLYRVVGLAKDSDSQLDGSRNEQRFFISPSLTWKINGRNTLTLLSGYQREPELGSYGGLPALGTIVPTAYGTLPRDYYEGAKNYEQFDRENIRVGYIFEHQFNDNWQAKQNFRYNNSNGIYRSVYGSRIASTPADIDFIKQKYNVPANAGNEYYQQFLVRGNYGSNAKNQAYTVDNNLTGKFNTGAVEHQVLFGLDYQYQDNDNSYVSAPADAGLIIKWTDPKADKSWSTSASLGAPTLQKMSQLGFYLQDQIKIDRLTITAGGRYDRAEQSTNEVDAPKNTALTGRLGAVYLFDNGLAPWASYSESFQPVTSTNSYDGKPFDPTEGKNIEVGLRYQSPTLPVFANFSVYDLRQQNILISACSIAPLDPLCTQKSVQSGEVQVKGAELEIRADINQQLNLLASYGYQDAENTRSFGNGSVAPGTSGTVRPLQGTVPVTVAKNIASLWAQYKFENPALRGVTLGAGARYTGSTWADSANTIKVPDYTVLDMLLGIDLGAWDSAFTGTSFSLNVNNLLDEDYVAACSNWCNYGPQRTIIGTLKYRW